MNLGTVFGNWWEDLSARHLIRSKGWAPVPSIRPAPLKRGASVLVVRLDRVGDVLLTTPLLHTMKSFGVKVTLAVSPYTVEMMTGHPDVSRLLMIRKGDLQPFEWFDAVIDPFVGFSLQSAWLARRTDAPVRLGYANRFTQNFFTYGVEPGSGYEGSRHLRFAELLGVPKLSSSGGPDQPTDDSELPRLVPSAEDHAFADRVWQQFGWGERDSILLVNPGSRRTTHRWPEEHYAWVAESLQRALGLRVGVTWGPGEERLAGWTAARIGERAVVMPSTTVRQLAALYRRATLVLCADSGPFHVAVSQRTSTAAVFGGSDDSRWAPFGLTWIKSFRAPRMELVPREEVLQGCEDLLKKRIHGRKI